MTDLLIYCPRMMSLPFCQLAPFFFLKKNHPGCLVLGPHAYILQTVVNALYSYVLWKKVASIR